MFVCLFVFEDYRFFKLRIFTLKIVRIVNTYENKQQEFNYLNEGGRKEGNRKKAKEKRVRERKRVIWTDR